MDRDRDADGRFSGQRVDVEQVPRLPTFPARWVLDDPRKRPYLVFWVSDDGDRCHAIQMAPTGQPDSVMVTFDDGATQRLTILRRSLPRGTGTTLFRCRCQRSCRYLYLLTLSGANLVSDLGLRCQVCARLRFGSQGCYRSAFFGLRGQARHCDAFPPQLVCCYAEGGTPKTEHVGPKRPGTVSPKVRVRVP